jgi:hypothetical protein
MSAASEVFPISSGKSPKNEKEEVTNERYPFIFPY